MTPDTKIPRLNPDLKLVKGSAAEDGTPNWRLYHPVSHQYFHLGWEEFEYLSRFSLCTTYRELADKLRRETTLEPDEERFKELLLFLNRHGLIRPVEGLPLTPPAKETKSLLSGLVHNYLFFSLPLVRPQKFLEATYPYVAFFFSKEASLIALLVLLYGAVMTFGRLDEFTATFLNLFSMEGALTVALVFTVIKLLHELGHAYTCIKYGLNVPHMGVAFMVMYPVFYTETTSAWALAGRREKVEIGLAGIRLELMLAAIFLLVWNDAAPGLLQSIAFSVVAISLLGSLLINLNPLMRFDGYFILGDALGIENLHGRGFACARWGLRKMLFGWQDECPEAAIGSRRRFLVCFGWATLIYRFFLFAGIAALVYMLFPKPFGLILMVIEVLWFIVLPILSELKVWISRSADLIRYTRGKMTFAIAFIASIFLFLPIQGHVNAPGVVHAAEYRDVYASYPSQLVQLNVAENKFVETGQVLARLESAELEKDYELTQISLEELEKQMRRQQTDVALLRENQALLQSRIDDLKIRLKSFQQKREQLTVKAPFNGYIKDMNPELHDGRYVSVDDLLFRVINSQQNLVTAYVSEQDIERIHQDNPAEFRAAYSLIETLPLHVKSIEKTNVANLDKAEVSSVYGGPVYSELFQSGNEAVRIVPRQSLYKVTLEPKEPEFLQVTSGIITIKAENVMPVSIFFHWLYALFLPESEIL